MIGIVIACHKEMSENLLNTVSYIMGSEPERVLAFSADLGMEKEGLKLKLSLAIGEVDSGDGVLVLTDIVGGTPSTLAEEFLPRKRIEVVTGVNLPMVLAAFNYREEMKLKRLSKMVMKTGKGSIFSLRG